MRIFSNVSNYLSRVSANEKYPGLEIQIHVRFEIRRSQSIFTIANPMEVLVRLAASNPDIEMRGAPSTTGAVVLIDEELLQIWAIENSTFWDGRAARVCGDRQRIAVRAITSGIFPSCVSKVDTTWVGDGTGAFRRVMVCCFSAGDVWAVAVWPAVESEDPNSSIEATLTRLERGLGAKTCDEREERDEVKCAEDKALRVDHFNEILRLRVLQDIDLKAALRGEALPSYTFRHAIVTRRFDYA